MQTTEESAIIHFIQQIEATEKLRTNRLIELVKKVEQIVRGNSEIRERCEYIYQYELARYMFRFGSSPQEAQAYVAERKYAIPLIACGNVVIFVVYTPMGCVGVGFGTEEYRHQDKYQTGYHWIHAVDPNRNLKSTEISSTYYDIVTNLVQNMSEVDVFELIMDYTTRELH